MQARKSLLHTRSNQVIKIFMHDRNHKYTHKHVHTTHKPIHTRYACTQTHTHTSYGNVKVGLRPFTVKDLLNTYISICTHSARTKRVWFQAFQECIQNIRLCMYDIYIYIYIYVYISIYIYIYIYAHTSHAHGQYIHACIHAYMHTHIHLQAHTHTYIYARREAGLKPFQALSKTAT
jgi:hypothetical protein